MSRALVMAGLLALAPAAFFSAQAGAQNPAPGQQQCADTAEKKAKRSMFGGLVSGLGGGLLGRAGIAGNVISLAMPVGSYLTDELLKMLDCKEQRQAAKATDDAIRGGVGTEVAWKSETRQNVSGKSKVTGAEQLADGTQCMTVTDVVIVDGEETTVPKKMCRAKGASGYARV
jgi:predicted lipid-binding transport protein (Tim44 family)